MKRNFILTANLMCLLLIGTLCMVIAGIQDASAQILDPDLVLYFDYEDFDGNTVLEKSGRGYDGEINGNVTQSDDGEVWQSRSVRSWQLLGFRWAQCQA